MATELDQAYELLRELNQKRRVKNALYVAMFDLANEVGIGETISIVEEELRSYEAALISTAAEAE